ncbi:MAG: SDR family NAD(P)-dependent oxidoreductase [Deltaproteobacteria bacterium]|nr:MAG: SDR family NAD(P)-dependent oxidoreductase [Deltaproteobacteria bacterium]
MTTSGRSVIATGGTGALGRAVVRAFLEAGDRVVVPWIVEAERAALMAAEPAAAGSGQLVWVEADVAEEDGADRVATAAGATDVLINGVGGFAGGSPVHDTPLEVWDRMYRMNVRSAVAMSRAALPGMIARRRGVIVNVASRAAFDRPASLAAYSAAKSAVVALTETLQREVEAYGIRVGAVVPTTIDTPANRAAMPDADPSAWTPPAQIAAAIRWLAGDEAACVRGALLPV